MGALAERQVVCRLKPDDLLIARLRPARVDPDELVVQALTYLAADRDRLLRFLTFMGIEACAIRAAAEMPRFGWRVLEYVAGERRLLAELADYANVRPEAIVHAREVLMPRDDDEGA